MNSALTVSNRVAELLRNPNAPLRDTREAEPRSATAASDTKPSTQPSPNPDGTQDYQVGGSDDRLTLSPLAQKILESEPAESDWEQRRSERTERARQLVQQQAYTLSPELVDNIAQKIVAMLP
jgi:hypothetical protein